MQKKGQITLFIIMGILVISTLFIFLAINGVQQTSSSKNQELDYNSKKIDVYVTSCLKKTATDALFQNSLHGGYFTLPEQSTTMLNENIAFYRNNSQIIYPDDKILAAEIAAYVDGMLDFCVQDFKEFRKQGIKISSNQHVSKAVLTQEYLMVTSEFPLKIQSGNKEQFLSSFEVTIPAYQFYVSLALSRQIVNTMFDNQICLSCFSDEAQVNNITINIIPLSDEVNIINLINQNYVLNEEKYHLRFGVYHEKK